MNILFCGDSSIEDGLLIACASLCAAVSEPLNITVLTMEISTADKQYMPVSSRAADYLDTYVKSKNPDSSFTLMDISELFKSELPEANMDTRFTPYCMLRLFADELDEIPDRILYMDTDVIVRHDITDFYYQDMEGCEVAGVLDYYGKWFFRQHFPHMDYLNSGVLLLNMALIRRNGLFKKCRQRCRDMQMFMPDQSAINKLAEGKRYWPRRYNEQRKLHKDTIVQHFTTTFRFFPWIHTVTVKPWQPDLVHQKLKIYEYDDLLEEYAQMKSAMAG